MTCPACTTSCPHAPLSLRARLEGAARLLPAGAMLQFWAGPDEVDALVASGAKFKSTDAGRTVSLRVGHLAVTVYEDTQRRAA